MLSLSANNAADAIIWALRPLKVGTKNEDANKCLCVDGVLCAFDATNLQEIWNSSMNAADHLQRCPEVLHPPVHEFWRLAC